jgi:DNA-binding response OmpR family regulator
MNKIVLKKKAMKKIYIVDDNTTIQQFLNIRLANKYDVSFYPTATLVYNQLRFTKDLPDLLVIDLGLPDMNGIELIERIKRSNFLKHISIIVLSGASKSDTRIEALKAGADYYMLKPFNPTEFDLVIEKFIIKSTISA